MTLLRSFTLRTPNLPKQAMPYTLDPTALEKIAALPLGGGSHRSIEDGMCVMEAVAYVAGEPWSDRPACAIEAMHGIGQAPAKDAR